jgi:phosphotransferase system enzyme I (PtsI)
MTDTSIQGTAVSEGLASGLGKFVSFDTVEISTTPCKNVQTELVRFESARSQAKKQVEALIGRRNSALGEDEKKIFAAHLMMLDDPEYVDQIRSLIEHESNDATKAVDSTSKAFATIFAALPDPYLAERADDVLDIGLRIIKILTGSSSNDMHFDDSYILLCRDILPSTVAELDPRVVKAVVAEAGGLTSHAAILLKNLEIPAIFATRGAKLQDLTGHNLLVDAQTGTIIANPTTGECTKFEKRQQELQAQLADLAELVNQPGITSDGRRINLLANIAGVKEIPVLNKYNPDGVGLFRTEFLFLHQRSAPSEAEQTEVYKKILEAMGKRKTTIRTLDIGGDKDVPYLNLPKEENPFLGLRGLRYCLENRDLFRQQLRALLRASPFGNLQIMYPMVTTINELNEANLILAEEKALLIAAGVNISPDIKVGIMIEVPAAAIMADAFASRVDFMSLGTNDLTQYTCACDRLNPAVKSLYNTYEPAVLHLIEMVADAAQKYNIELSVCGEMAGNQRLAPFFLGIGIVNLSMSPPGIPRLKRRLASLTMAASTALAKRALACNSATEVAAIFAD